MPIYHKLGDVPKKRHVQFRKPDGSGLYREEVMGLEGFSGIQSILYHHHLPTKVLKAEFIRHDKPNYVDFGPLRHRQLVTKDIPAGSDPVTGRRTLMGNADVTIGISRPTEEMMYYYRNGQAYELWFVHEGRGVLRSQFGRLPFHEGDYIIIPYGVTWKMELEGSGHRFLVVESPSEITTPKRYRNKYGQFLEHSPFCERDFRLPQELETYTETGEFEVHVKVRDQIQRHVVAFHPFDVVGWDGLLYPWIFNINDFEPITGRVHQPPPVHQNFEGWNYVICSFVPRIFDYHPEAIPAPYNHSNVNSDEVIYYVDGNFMSRKGVDKYDFTLHPYGMPHGPQPGMTEASIGKERTEELAVMVDTFRPLQITAEALELENPDYLFSWLQEE